MICRIETKTWRKALSERALYEASASVTMSISADSGRVSSCCVSSESSDPHPESSLLSSKKASRVSCLLSSAASRKCFWKLVSNFSCLQWHERQQAPGARAKTIRRNESLGCICTRHNRRGSVGSVVVQRQRKPVTKPNSSHLLDHFLVVKTRGRGSLPFVGR